VAYALRSSGRRGSCRIGKQVLVPITRERVSALGCSLFAPPVRMFIPSLLYEGACGLGVACSKTTHSGALGALTRFAAAGQRHLAALHFRCLRCKVAFPCSLCTFDIRQRRKAASALFIVLRALGDSRQSMGLLIMGTALRNWACCVAGGCYGKLGFRCRVAERRNRTRGARRHAMRTRDPAPTLLTPRPAPTSTCMARAAGLASGSGGKGAPTGACSYWHTAFGGPPAFGPRQRALQGHSHRPTQGTNHTSQGIA
jgi:hypothetical protein